jgi:hypothetical protein
MHVMFVTLAIRYPLLLVEVNIDSRWFILSRCLIVDESMNRRMKETRKYRTELKNDVLFYKSTQVIKGHEMI